MITIFALSIVLASLALSIKVTQVTMRMNRAKRLEALQTQILMLDMDGVS